MFEFEKYNKILKYSCKTIKHNSLMKVNTNHDKKGIFRKLNFQFSRYMKIIAEANKGKLFNNKLANGI